MFNTTTYVVPLINVTFVQYRCAVYYMYNANCVIQYCALIITRCNSAETDDLQKYFDIYM